MGRVDLIREQLKSAHDFMGVVMQGVTAEQAQWAPPGRANPLGATFFHAAESEDNVVNGMVRGSAPLHASTLAGKTGASEAAPMGPAWNEWARRVKVDLPQAGDYLKSVAAATDAWLASLTDADLEKSVDFSAFGLGQQTVAWTLSNVVVGHLQNHIGEISCLKGLQGSPGYPF